MKNKIQYKCNKCGKTFSKWTGQCTSCKEWNSLEEFIENESNKTKIISNGKKAVLLKDVKNNSASRIKTGIIEFDRVMGGGVVNDSVTIMSAPPGCGKSTLCLMICDKLLSLGKKGIYASGEESASQIKNRAIRLGLTNIDKLWIIDDTNLDCVIDELKNTNSDFLILDSIQTFYLNEFLPSRAGNPTQVIECASIITDFCKRNPAKPLMAILIGQMTKDDELAGSRALEHLVDTYLRMYGDSDDTLRILEPIKNRFGNTGENGFFNMTETGLECIDNPSEYFMTERVNPIIGTSLTVLKEGSRPIITEIESIVSKSFTSYPSRIADCLRRDQLNTLIPILEQRAGLNLIDKNVIIKTSGGIKLVEPSSNLAILMTITSSYKKIAIDKKVVFIADVGLTGELKKVPNLETRIKELDRMEYNKVYIAKNALSKPLTLKKIKIIECETLKDVINDCFK